MHWLDWSLLTIYFVVVMALGYIASKLIKNRGDFLMGGRRFGGIVLSFVNFGGGTHTDQAVVTAQAAAQKGFPGIWVQMINLFVTPFYWIMAPVFRRARCYTISDIVEKRFGSSLAAMYTIMGMVTISLSMGMMLKASSSMVRGVVEMPDLVNLGLFTLSAEAVIIILMTILFVAYGVMGGLVAAAWTDVLQGVLTIILSFMMLPFLFAEVGGMSGLHQRLAEETGRQAELFGLVSAEIGVFFIVMTVINSIIMNAGHPATIMGFAAGKREIQGRIGKVYGNMLKRFCIIGWALVGVGAIVLYPDVVAEDAGMVFGHAAKQLLPIGLVGLMLAAAMAAMMSSCDNWMITAAGLFTENFYKRFFVPEGSERHYVFVNRVASIAVVVGGIGFAYVMPDLIQGLRVVWAVPALMGIVFWLGILWKRMNLWGAWAAFLAAGGMYLLCRVIGPGDGWDQFVAGGVGRSLFYPLYLKIHGGVAGLGLTPWNMLYYTLAGIIAGTVVSLLTPRPDKRKVDDFFLTIRTPIGQEDKLREAGVDFIYK